MYCNETPEDVDGARRGKRQKVGVAIVRELFGAMAAAGATGAYVVTSGVFTKEAQRFSEGRNIALVDGDALQVLIAHAQESKTAGVEGESQIGRPESVHDWREPTIAATETIPQCPPCDGPLVKRVARRGVNAGKAFWGCAKYPKCRGTRQM